MAISGTVLGELVVAPSPLSCCDALALLCASRSFAEDRLKVVALYKWYCSFWVDSDVESSIELLPLWRQLLVSLQSVKLAKHPGGAQRWQITSSEDLKIAVQALCAAEETEEPREYFATEAEPRTGANSGIGKEIAQFLATKGATLYMVCRSKDRAEAAREEIVTAAAGDSSSRVHILLADCSLEADVRRCWDEFCAHRMKEGTDGVRLNGLVCNAGALANTKTMTSEEVEVTFAAHLLFGTYLLGKLAMPCLEATVDSRLVVVSSGGMYNTAFPKWEDATWTGTSKYDGQCAKPQVRAAFTAREICAKRRGQVLLCEEWAKSHPKVKVVSCHPGWTSTPGVDAAYGSSQSYLQPLRSLWQGAEGIIWLLVAEASKLQAGAFYLDREPQVKHMAGPFFTEGSATKNSPGEVADMMRLLEDWSEGRRDSATRLASAPLKAMERSIELSKFMGKWYVIANIPTYFDKGTSNNIENYSLDESGKTVMVDFTYKQGSSSKLLQQKAEVVNDACTQWAISPKIGVFIPLRLAYLVVDCAEDYSTCIIGVPDRRYLWIMARTPQIAEPTLDALIAKSRSLGFDDKEIVRVPQEVVIS